MSNYKPEDAASVEITLLDPNGKPLDSMSRAMLPVDAMDMFDNLVDHLNSVVFDSEADEEWVS